jgi:MerR family transcriptional regulator, redox-sensitive transcriptional activator SoxR
METRNPDQLTIGELATRSGVATSALRYYEAIGLITGVRTAANHRRYSRATLRVVALIRVAQGLGLSLEEIQQALATIASAPPTMADWERLSLTWRDGLTARIDQLTQLRDELTSCIGCGCLSLERCALYNPGDRAARRGAGPRYLLGDSSDETAG